MNVETLPGVKRSPGPEGTSSGGLTVKRVMVIFLVVFSAGIAVRLWRLGISPAWQWDEAVYWRVSANVQHGSLTEHSLYGVPWEPFLYQPPIYFEIESRWFDVVGASIYHARIFGVLCALAGLIVSRDPGNVGACVGLLFIFGAVCAACIYKMKMGIYYSRKKHPGTTDTPGLTTQSSKLSENP